MNNLANTYVALRRHDDALALREETLAACRRVMGPDHPDTLMGMHNLANSLAALRRHDDALKLREETVAAYQRVLSHDHPDTLKSMNNLANSYQALGRHDDAHRLREETQAAFKRVLGPHHPDTLTSQWRLAESLVKLDRGAEAIPLIDACMAHAAGKLVDPRLLPAVIILRLRHFQNTNDPGGCRTTAETWEKLNRSDVDSLLAAARIRSVTAAVQSRMPGTESARLAAEDGRCAMASLARACAAGFKDRASLDKDKDLDFLRDQEDFRKLLGSLPEVVMPP
jgi:tetratricopeptide (TPR) repeat protein